MFTPVAHPGGDIYPYPASNGADYVGSPMALSRLLLDWASTALRFWNRYWACPAPRLGGFLITGLLPGRVSNRSCDVNLAVVDQNGTRRHRRVPVWRLRPKLETTIVTGFATDRHFLAAEEWLQSAKTVACNPAFPICRQLPRQQRCGEWPMYHQPPIPFFIAGIGERRSECDGY